MITSNFTTSIVVDQTPQQAFDAIKNVAGWWSEEIEGNTDTLGDVFFYHFEDIHRCQLKLIELTPERKLVWLVMDNYFKPGIFISGSASSHHTDKFAKDQTEWKGTKISFEISRQENKSGLEQTRVHFTHIGLVPEYECFDVCSNGWTHYINESLFNLINTGKGHPNRTGRPMTTDEQIFHSSGGKA